ncbi:hypothetical protein N7536_011073 [Penicillium majusculum]|nr:hypothetical protein N7536_011073 [Penicillium majusculum]
MQVCVAWSREWMHIHSKQGRPCQLTQLGTGSSIDMRPAICGQGCLEDRHVGPAQSSECAKVSEEPATLMNVPIIQKSP